jgi:hypothetical protein
LAQAEVSVEESTRQTLALWSAITGAQVVEVDFTESEAFYQRCLKYVQSSSGQAAIQELNTAPIQLRPPTVETEDIRPSMTPHAKPLVVKGANGLDQTL